MRRVALVCIVASLGLLACQTDTPESFQGLQGPTKTGTSSKDKTKKTTSSETTTDSDSKAGTDPAPTSTTPATTTTPPKTEAALPACGGSATFQACLTCCDTAGVYQPFYTKILACGADTTCRTAASTECFASPTCTTADKCMEKSGCWQKTDPEAEAAPEDPTPEDPPPDE